MMKEITRNESEAKTSLKRLEAMADLGWLFRKVLHLWWLFVAVAILAGAVGYFYAKASKIKYKSNLTFALDDGKSSASGIISLASELGFNFSNGVTVFSGDNILNIIKSRQIVEDVLTSSDTFGGQPRSILEHYLDLVNYYSDKSTHKLYFPVDLRRENYSYQQDSLLKAVYLDFSRNYVKAERPDKRLSIYELNVTTPDEKLTKIITDRLVEKANEFYIKIRTQKSKQTVEVLEQRVASMKGNLNQSIVAQAEVKDVNINPAFSKAQVPVLKQQSNMQVFGTAYAELYKNLELARFQYLNDMPLMQVIDEANYPMEIIKRGKLYTAALFAFIACAVLFLAIWLRRVSAIMKVKS